LNEAVRMSQKKKGKNGNNRESVILRFDVILC